MSSADAGTIKLPLCSRYYLTTSVMKGVLPNGRWPFRNCRSKRSCAWSKPSSSLSNSILNQKIFFVSFFWEQIRLAGQLDFDQCVYSCSRRMGSFTFQPKRLLTVVQMADYSVLWYRKRPCCQLCHNQCDLLIMLNLNLPWGLVTSCYHRKTVCWRPVANLVNNLRS